MQLLWIIILEILILCEPTQGHIRVPQVALDYLLVCLLTVVGARFTQQALSHQGVKKSFTLTP